MPFMEAVYILPKFKAVPLQKILLFPTPFSIKRHDAVCICERENKKQLAISVYLTFMAW